MTSIRVVGYVRCSTTEQFQDGLSLAAQERRLAAWSEAAGAELVEVITDAGVSGTVPLERRPQGRRIAELLDLRRPQVDAVVITRLDRLSRNAADALAHLRRFSTGRLGLVSVADHLDLSTPQGRAMAQLGAVFSELERGLIAQRTSEALQLLRDQRKVYSPVPYGYRDQEGSLVEVAEEQEIIDRLRGERGTGVSYARIADGLNEDGVCSRRGGRWYASSVRSVLRTSAHLQGCEVTRAA